MNARIKLLLTLWLCVTLTTVSIICSSMFVSMNLNRFDYTLSSMLQGRWLLPGIILCLLILTIYLCALLIRAYILILRHMVSKEPVVPIGISKLIKKMYTLVLLKFVCIIVSSVLISM